MVAGAGMVNNSLLALALLQYESRCLTVTYGTAMANRWAAFSILTPASPKITSCIDAQAE